MTVYLQNIFIGLYSPINILTGEIIGSDLKDFFHWDHMKQKLYDDGQHSLKERESLNLRHKALNFFMPDMTT